jgi:hypothetical protein
MVYANLFTPFLFDGRAGARRTTPNDHAGRSVCAAIAPTPWMSPLWGRPPTLTDAPGGPSALDRD